MKALGKKARAIRRENKAIKKARHEENRKKAKEWQRKVEEVKAFGAQAVSNLLVKNIDPKAVESCEKMVAILEPSYAYFLDYYNGLRGVKITEEGIKAELDEIQPGLSEKLNETGRFYAYQGGALWLNDTISKLNKVIESFQTLLQVADQFSEKTQEKILEKQDEILESMQK